MIVDRMFQFLFKKLQADQLMPKKLVSNKLIPNHGQSLLEVVVALAIFALLAATLLALSAGSFIGLTRGGEQTQAASLADEGIEAVRSIHDRAWNELIYSPARVTPNIVSGQWELSSAASELIDNKYTRTITFDDVCRNAAGDIVPCPGDYTDAHGKRVTVKVDWLAGAVITNTVERVAYLTNWDSREWTQTDWSGGSGQPTWSDVTKYDSGSSIDANVPGSLRLARETGVWVQQGGNNFVDNDFSGGTNNGTAIENPGSENANVILGQNQDWLEHPDSRVATTVNMYDMSAVSDTNIWAVGNGGRILNYNGANWSPQISPVTNNLFGVHMMNDSLGWAVGGTARILRYQNGVWSQETVTGTTTNWNDVQFYSDGVGGWRGWVVGDNGRIRRYRFYNNTWTQELNFVFGTTNWRSVSVRSANEAWVVGSGGNIRRWNGATWSAVSSPVSNNLYGLYMFANGPNWQGWAVGGTGTIIYYNGTSWSRYTPSPVNNNLRSVYLASSTDGWAVGGSGKILRWNGASWTEFKDTGLMTWLTVLLTSSDSGWVIGENGRIYQYNNFYNASGTFLSRILDAGASATWNSLYWTEVLTSGASITIATRTGNTPLPDGTWSSFSAELTNSTSSTITSPSPRRYLQYRATLNRGPVGTETPKLADITILYDNPTTQTMHDLSVVPGSNGNNIWAVGNNGTLLNYNGALWSSVSSGVTNNLYGIQMISTNPGDGWIVGGSGRILRWDGSQWTIWPTSPTVRDLNAVFMVNANDVWAVGNNGTIIHFDGTNWSTAASPVNNNFYGIYMVSANDGWIVGGSGTILRYQNPDWTTVSSPVSNDLNSVFMVSVDDGWAAGWRGKILRWTGGAVQQWSEIDTGNQTWQSVFMTWAANGWVIGGSGNIYHFNGSNWSPYASPTARDLRSVEMVSETDGWAVGVNGTLIRFTQSGRYLTSGTLLSSAFSFGDDSPVLILEWDDNSASCAPACSVRFQVRAAADAAGAPGAWSAWYGATGPSTYFTNADGTVIPAALNNNRWVQYRVELGGDGTATPVLDEVRINYR